MIKNQLADRMLVEINKFIGYTKYTVHRSRNKASINVHDIAGNMIVFAERLSDDNAVNHYIAGMFQIVCHIEQYK